MKKTRSHSLAGAVVGKGPAEFRLTAKVLSASEVMLQRAVVIARAKADYEDQHGPVRILMKDGNPV